MVSDLRERLNYRIGLEASRLRAPWLRKSGAFRDIRTYCMFLGYARSGHSLVGALLDAHPNVVIAHELDALKYIQYHDIQRDHLYALALRNSAQFTRNGRFWEGYSYAVQNQWQGKYTKLYVIGDKKGGGSADRLTHKPELLERLAGLIGDDTMLRIVHVVRNPYDNIGSMFKGDKTRPSLDELIDYYFTLCQTVASVMSSIDPEQLVTVRHEDVIRQPRHEFSRLCAFLGLDCSEAYLDACASVVFESPRKSRYAVEWTPEAIERVSARMRDFAFLAGYSFED